MNLASLREHREQRVQRDFLAASQSQIVENSQKQLKDDFEEFCGDPRTPEGLRPFTRSRKRVASEPVVVECVDLCGDFELRLKHPKCLVDSAEVIEIDEEFKMTEKETSDTPPVAKDIQNTFTASQCADQNDDLICFVSDPIPNEDIILNTNNEAKESSFQSSEQTFGSDTSDKSLDLKSNTTGVSLSSVDVADVLSVGESLLNQKPTTRKSYEFDDGTISLSSSQSSIDEQVVEKDVAKTSSEESLLRFSTSTSGNCDICIPESSADEAESNNDLTRKSSPSNIVSIHDHGNYLTSNINGVNSNPQRSVKYSKKEIFDRFVRLHKLLAVDGGFYRDDDEDDNDSVLDDLLDRNYKPSDDESVEMRSLPDASMELETYNYEDDSSPPFEYSSSDFEELNFCISRLVDYAYNYSQINDLLTMLCNNFNRQFQREEFSTIVSDASNAISEYRKEKAKKRFHSRMKFLMNVDFEDIELPQEAELDQKFRPRV